MTDQRLTVPRIKEAKRNGSLTLPDSDHLWPQQDLVFEVDNLALVRVYDLQSRIDN